MTRPNERHGEALSLAEAQELIAEATNATVDDIRDGAAEIDMVPLEDADVVDED